MTATDQHLVENGK